MQNADIDQEADAEAEAEQEAVNLNLPITIGGDDVWNGNKDHGRKGKKDGKSKDGKSKRDGKEDDGRDKGNNGGSDSLALQLLSNEADAEAENEALVNQIATQATGDDAA